MEQETVLIVDPDSSSLKLAAAVLRRTFDIRLPFEPANCDVIPLAPQGPKEDAEGICERSTMDR